MVLRAMPSALAAAYGVSPDLTRAKARSVAADVLAAILHPQNVFAGQAGFAGGRCKLLAVLDHFRARGDKSAELVAINLGFLRCLGGRERATIVRHGKQAVVGVKQLVECGGRYVKFDVLVGRGREVFHFFAPWLLAYCDY